MKMKRVETIQDNFRLLALTCAHFQASFIKYLNKYQISHNMNSKSNRVLYIVTEIVKEIFHHDYRLRTFPLHAQISMKYAQTTGFADYTECIF